MGDIVKVCKKHGELKKEDTVLHAPKYRLRCRLCRREAAKKCYAKNPSRHLELKKQSRLKFPEKRRLIDKNKKRRDKENLSDCYILASIRRTLKTQGIPLNITKEMIEKRRSEIIFYRSKVGKFKEWAKEKNKKRNSLKTKYHVENLTDLYIKRLIINNSKIEKIKNDDIPQDFVELYRVHILLLRKIKKLPPIKPS